MLDRRVDLDRATDRLIARALTFKERQQLYRRGVLVGALSSDQDRARRLRRWTFWLTSDGAEPTGWQDFLSAHGITEDELLTIADARPSKPPRQRWVRTFRGLLAYLSGRDLRSRKDFSSAEHLASPAVRYAWCELHRSQGQRLGELLHPRAAAALRAMLRSHLARGAARIVAEARTLAAGTGNHPEIVPAPVATLQASDNRSSANGLGLQTFRLLNAYPALARLWANQIDHWLDFTGDFLRAVEDLLVHPGPSVHRTGPAVRWIKPELSDRHDGGRTVLEVRLADGEHRFYKPRSGEHEKGWFGLLHWLNDEGFRAPFQIVDVQNGKNSCWMAAVPHRSCRTRAEVAQVYFRAGSLLCLIHLLGGVDVHAQNLVVNGSQPVIIDTETLFHPDPPRRIAGRQPLRSVLRTGMLPIAANLASGQDSVSALGRRAPGPHSVRLRNQIVPVARYAPAVVEGFRAMQEFLGQPSARSRQFNQMVQELRQLRWRRILRPTTHYHSMLGESLSPALLRDGLDRSLYLYAACGPGQRPPGQRRAEAACLEQGDIPRFYRHASGTLSRRHADLGATTAAILAVLGGVTEPAQTNPPIRVSKAQDRR